MIRVSFLIPAVALESMAVGVLVIEYALIASAIPGAIAANDTEVVTDVHFVVHIAD